MIDSASSSYWKRNIKMLLINISVSKNFCKRTTLKRILENKELKGKESTKAHPASYRLATTKMSISMAGFEASKRASIYKIAKRMSDKSSTLAYVNENEQKTDQTSK
jgi:hypothetical protein